MMYQMKLPYKIPKMAISIQIPFKDVTFLLLRCKAKFPEEPVIGEAMLGGYLVSGVSFCFVYTG